jgi:hypothetical protein
VWLWPGSVTVDVAVCVWLTVKENVWNFPIGIFSCGAYLVFFGEGRLFADAGLQVVFIVLNIVGWIAWARGKVVTKPVMRIQFASQFFRASQSAPFGRLIKPVAPTLFLLGNTVNAWTVGGREFLRSAAGSFDILILLIRNKGIG